MTLVIVLFLIAMTLVIAEVMFPSFGVLGLLAATAFLFAVLKAFEVGSHAGLAAVAATIVSIPGSIWLGFVLLKHSPVGNRLLLSGPPPRTMTSLGPERERLKSVVGRAGTAVSPLRPTGSIDIDGERIDAVTEGAYIEAGCRVRVVRTELNQAVVVPDDDPADS